MTLFIQASICAESVAGLELEKLPGDPDENGVPDDVVEDLLLRLVVHRDVLGRKAQDVIISQVLSMNN